ncbi:ACT domain-containing protein [Paenarthrobacter aromaticivorans]|uniref:ACT domain-containing protein n=1 Tax=Paenarthrobacter aromaticivorans TaxID=2849150 RepID=UPI003A807DB4
MNSKPVRPSNDTAHSISLVLLDGDYSICRFEPKTQVPPLSGPSDIYSLTTTHLETSLVCSTAAVPAGGRTESGWRVLYVEGPIPFDLTGVIAGITSTVAAAGLPVFVLSTFDSDLLLLRGESLDKAIAALNGSGYLVATPAIM